MVATKYLIDNNALGPLGDRKMSQFFIEHCRVPAEVAHESRRAKHARLLEPVTMDITPPVLVELVRVMKSVRPGDTDLIDLYSFTGTADPILVAMALALGTQDLFADKWVIVTEDKAVADKATEFAIDTLTPKKLATLIDAATD